jgi:undecaprenyl diphosphate synthase
MKKLPQHIAIIMDGNGRWAQQRKLPRIAGHKVGADSVREVVRCCSDLGVAVLTLFAFSTENWKRPEKEVSFLMQFFSLMLKRELPQLLHEKVQLRFIGDRTSLNSKLQKVLAQAEQLTANNSGLKLVIAINYSGRWDIINAAQTIARAVATKSIKPDEVTQEVLQSYIALSDLPEPDLCIRTSGEQRISNFMLWQLAYTEFYFTDVLWPDFREKELQQALAVYAERKRRFGAI